jgi:hypothetical protein
MKSIVLKTIALALFATACGGGSSVDLVGKSDQEQADEVADAICEQSADCGEVSIECTSDQDGNLDCTGLIEPVAYDACYADTYGDVLEDFQSCDLTAEEEQTIEDCVNAILDQGCVSQGELDDFIAEIEAGNDDAQLRPIPTACVQTSAIFESCS